MKNWIVNLPHIFWVCIQENRPSNWRRNFYCDFREPKISRKLMAKYITYAKEYFVPKLSEAAAKKLTECYM